LSEAKEEVSQWREEAIQRAREEIRDLRGTWVENLEGEQDAFERNLKTRVTEQVLHISQKVLQDLANESLEAQVVQTFLEKIRKEDKASFGEAFREHVELKFKTALPLTSALQERVESLLRDLFPRAKVIEFSAEESLNMEVHLVAGDSKLEWGLSRYLRDLEKEILPLLNQTTRGAV
jgi:F-type H+-transporting ATPase subunit b